MSATMFSVNYFSKHPDKTDQCLTGFDFATLAEAEAFIASDPLATDNYYGSCTKYIVLDGPSLPDLRIIENHHYEEDEGMDWIREHVMQSRMMGDFDSGSEPYDPAIHDQE